MAKKFNMLSVLNESSLQQVEAAATIKNIDITFIEPNEQNFYAIEGIKSLMMSIRVCGLFDNFVVRKISDTRYKLISGHRRYAACKELYDSGCIELATVPCKVYECTEDEEYCLLMEGNVHNRIRSDYELMMEMSERKKMYERFKEQGHSLGAKMREILAADLQISETKIHNLSQVETKLVPELKEKMRVGDLSLGTAVKIAQEPQEKQEDIERNIREEKTELKQRARKEAVGNTVLRAAQESKDLRVVKMAERMKVLYGEVDKLNQENKEKFKLLEEQAYKALSEINEMLSDNN